MKINDLQAEIKTLTKKVATLRLAITRQNHRHERQMRDCGHPASTPTPTLPTTDKQVIRNLIQAFMRVTASAQQNMHKYEQQDQASHGSSTMKYMVLHPIRHEVMRAYEQATAIYNDLPSSFFHIEQDPCPKTILDNRLTQIDKFLTSTLTME